MTTKKMMKRRTRLKLTLRREETPRKQRNRKMLNLPESPPEARVITKRVRKRKMKRRTKMMMMILKSFLQNHGSYQRNLMSLRLDFIARKLRT